MYRIRQFINLFLLHLNVHLVFLENKKRTLKFHGLILFRMGVGGGGGGGAHPLLKITFSTISPDSLH